MRRAGCLWDVTERVSLASDGSQGNGPSTWPGGLSADGRFVVFQSEATNFAPGVISGVYVHDRNTGLTESAAVGGTCPAISGDGRLVAFWIEDVRVRDRVTGANERVDVASDGTAANDVSGLQCSLAISSDGRIVAFTSLATNLVAGDTNGREDVFVHDRQTGTTERVDIGSDGAQANGGGLLDR